MKKPASTLLAGEPIQLPEGHRNIAYGKIGVLLINLGTPDGHDTPSMRRYLREFLSDRRVIEWSRFYWYPILYGIVLNTRPKKSGALYRAIWNQELDESPLRTITRSQSDKLAERLAGHRHIIVDWAMRYGNPSIDTRINDLVARGCNRILAFPLYPQYSATTTATVNDKVFESLMKLRAMPALRVVPAYPDHPAYIEALAKSVENHLAALDHPPEKIIASYHGIPKDYFEKGDFYHCHCHKTTRLLRERLNLDEDRLITCFQSRFGPAKWLQPYTDQTVADLAKSGTKRISVINPGFASDCLETLEEIAGEVAEIFRINGGKQFSHIACLNDSADGMDVIEAMVRNELAGWI